MKFETIKNKKYFLYVLIIGIILFITMVVSASLTEYKITESIKIASGNIKQIKNNKKLAIYIKEEGASTYTNTDTIPESGYILNSEESYCEVNGSNINAIISYDMNSKTISITPLESRGTKCFLYFDEYIPSAKDQILANITNITSRTNFNTAITAQTTGTIYEAEDDDGTTYYFAGNPTDNWIKFAGLYWRIIRINGDGTIRMIYQGSLANTTGTGTQLSNQSVFNSSAYDNMYVGYLYSMYNGHGLGTKSTILVNSLEPWYTSNLSNYAGYIDQNAGFCGDRQSSTSNSSINGMGGTGTTRTYYGAQIRNSGVSGTKKPTFKCEYKDNNGTQLDLYTKSGSPKGNQALTVPIGLITNDEAEYAGRGTGSNQNYYLYTNQNYWTMTPYDFANDLAVVNTIGTDGGIYGNSVNRSYGVRPVINLRADVTFKEGTTGTSTNPYEVI